MREKRGLSYETLMEKVDSPYTLVIAAAKRARQLNDGEKPMVDSTDKKAVSNAIDEIISGKITIVRKRVDGIK